MLCVVYGLKLLRLASNCYLLSVAFHRFERVRFQSIRFCGGGGGGRGCVSICCNGDRGKNEMGAYFRCPIPCPARLCPRLELSLLASWPRRTPRRKSP